MSTWPLGYGRSYGMSARWPETPYPSQRSGSTGNSRPQATSANGKKSEKGTSPSLGGKESQLLPHVWFLNETQPVVAKGKARNGGLEYRANSQPWGKRQGQ